MKTKLILLVCLVCVLVLPSLSVRADALPEQEPTPTDTKIAQTDPIEPTIQISPIASTTPTTPPGTLPLSVAVTIGLGVLVVIVLVASGIAIGEIKKNSGKPKP